MIRSTTFGKSIAILVFSILLLATGFVGFKMYKSSKIIKSYKEDFFTVNQLKFGLLNGENWSWQVERVISLQIDSIEFTQKNKEVMQAQIERMMNKMLTKVDQIIHRKQETFKKNLQYKVLNSLVEIDDFRKDVPDLAKTLVDEIDKTKNRDAVKEMLKEKVGQMLENKKSFVIPERDIILGVYNRENVNEFNKFIKYSIELQDQKLRKLGYILIGLMATTLFVWWFIIKKKFFELFAVGFLFSVLISLVNLFIGIYLPMIDIDARIAQVDLHLLKSNIEFYDQIIFYQSKSILDVVLTLLKNGKIDTIFVGILVGAFSILFPIGKLIAATVYLFNHTKNRFIHFMAFKSGKWSMADVMVVAIFMAFIGFQGILSSQLQKVNMQSETVNLISTNKSSLQTGFIVFVAFVMFNLILSSILKRITNKDVHIAKKQLRKEMINDLLGSENE